jgi:CheY-like chemotaxis protein
VSPRTMMATADVEILLVDDSAANAELMLQLLAEDHPVDRIHVVDDGAEALDFLFCRGAYASRSSCPLPRVILFGLEPPAVDGLEVLRAIRADPRTRAIPVVMLTSSNLGPDVARGYHLGANSVVRRPVEFERLRDVVRRLGRYWLTVNEPMP